ncbi:MAG TPA: glycosyltransferase [Herpetosiphonaceae bacterium]
MTEPIRVLQLIDGFATEEHSGGAALFGIQLARHLPRELIRPAVCGLWRYGTPSERRWRATLEAEGIETLILLDEPGGGIVKNLVKAEALLWQALGRLRTQVISSHFERGDLLGLASKLLHPLHPPLVRTMHADQQWQNRRWAGQLINLTAYPWLVNHEVAISETTRQVMDRRIMARLRGRRATLLYNGLGREFLARVAGRGEAAPRAAGAAPRFGLIGRLEPQKGHRDFLAACEIVLERLPGAEFWLIGAGPLRDELAAAAAARGLTGAVRFLGPRSDIPELLAELDVFVSASLWEGFPTVVLEAMAAGVPVIATDVSGSRELVREGETGLLVPVGAPERLAAAMVRMAEDPGAALAMAGRARERIQPYTMQHTAASYAELYRGLATAS